jgi:hypothetical protein
MDQNNSTVVKKMKSQGITQRKTTFTNDQLFTAGGKDMFDANYVPSSYLGQFTSLTPSNSNKAQP